jgi:hypothetical protein
MSASKAKATQQEAVWCNKHEASQILGVSQSTLKNLRLTNQLIEGIHWTRFSSRCVRYNIALLKDWAMNRADVKLHDRGIVNYLGNLPSYQTEPPTCKPARVPRKVGSLPE